MRIAVPITARTMQQACLDIKEASSVADIIELRLDYLCHSNFDPIEEKLQDLLSQSNKPCIVTNRVQSEGGKFKGSEEERMEYLEAAAALGAEYIDLEFAYLRPFERKDSKLIVSHHNFNETPANLRDIYERIAQTEADIVKIATKANCSKDSWRMLELIAEAEKPIIGICMDTLGEVTRILGPAFGSYLTFGIVDDSKSSAPGQVSVEKIREYS